jgi:hypothetical protein
VAAFDWVLFALYSVPGADIFIPLLEANVSKGEPQEESCDWEEVLRRNKESVHDEETSEEMHTEKELGIAESSEPSVAREDFPFPNAVLAVATHPIVFLDTKFSHHINTEKDGGGV